MRQRGSLILADELYERVRCRVPGCDGTRAPGRPPEKRPPVTRYGYARVSMKEQNPNSQHDAHTAAGLAEENIVTEKISGKRASSRAASA